MNVTSCAATVAESEINVVDVSPTSSGPGYKLPAEPARQLANLSQVPLAQYGVTGNSHGSMFERNNAEVLSVLTTWMLVQLTD